MLRRRSARLGINGCIISGIVLGSLYGLMPLYLSHQGMSDANVGYWMALLVSSGIVGQWPVGRLADRFGRLLVLRVQVFVVILASVAMLGNYAMAPALFVLGLRWLYPLPGGDVLGLREGAAARVGGDESGAADELHHWQPAGPVDDGDADAKLFRSPAVCDDCGRGAGLPADAAEEAEAGSPSTHRWPHA